MIDDGALKNSDSSPDFRSRMHGVGFLSGKLPCFFADFQQSFSRFYYAVALSWYAFLKYILYLLSYFKKIHWLSTEYQACEVSKDFENFLLRWWRHVTIVLYCNRCVGVAWTAGGGGGVWGCAISAPTGVQGWCPRNFWHLCLIRRWNGLNLNGICQCIYSFIFLSVYLLLYFLV